MKHLLKKKKLQESMPPGNNHENGKWFLRIGKELRKHSQLGHNLYLREREKNMFGLGLSGGFPAVTTCYESHGLMANKKLPEKGEVQIEIMLLVHASPLNTG